jgi:hypothetical protein
MNLLNEERPLVETEGTFNRKPAGRLNFVAQSTRRNALAHAAELLELGWARAVLGGDREAAARLDRLVRLVSDEAAYAANVDSGLPVVRRRDVLPGATIGWLIDNDPTVRVMREINHTAPAPRVAVSA